MRIIQLEWLKSLFIGVVYKMKNIINSILPNKIYTFVRAVVRYVRLGKSYFYDMNLYFKYSMSIDNASEKKLISKIILDTHVIEKGLTMPETKLGFGVERLSVLISNIISFVSNFMKNEPQVLHAISVVSEYISFHRDKGYTIDSKLMHKFEKLCEIEKINSLKFENRNQKNTTRDEYFKFSNSSFKDFSESRSSIRNFSDEEVCKDQIYNVLNLCRNTPSACNRQAVRVHLFTNKDEIGKILDIQGGNRGFGHLTTFLFIVTYESSVYFEESERNSGLVDGGMFCMNILYSLHANQIAGCILNAAHNPAKDIQMRKQSKIPDSEYFVAMIACGIPPRDFKIATSFRYPLSYTMVEH